MQGLVHFKCPIILIIFFFVDKKIKENQYLIGENQIR